MRLDASISLCLRSSLKKIGTNRAYACRKCGNHAPYKKGKPIASSTQLYETFYLKTSFVKCKFLNQFSEFCSIVKKRLSSNTILIL